MFVETTNSADNLFSLIAIMTANSGNTLSIYTAMVMEVFLYVEFPYIIFFVKAYITFPWASNFTAGCSSPFGGFGIRCAASSTN